MPQISPNSQLIFRSDRIIPFFLSTAVVIDYTLTLYLAGSVDTILKYEFSPFLRYAVKNDIVSYYLLFTIIFYYLSSNTILRLLRGEKIYSMGVALILLLGITHILGGLSWIIRSEWYSNTVLTLSLASIALAVASFGYVITRQSI